MSPIVIKGDRLSERYVHTPPGGFSVGVSAAKFGRCRVLWIELM